MATLQALVRFAAILIALFHISPVFADHLEDGIAAFEAKDYPKAFSLLLPLAESGQPRAQGVLARMYGSGWGVAKDVQSAYLWASRGILKDDPVSQTVIGSIYFFGDGVLPKDAKEGSKWWKKAADQGYARAQYLLALSYASGDGVPITDEAAEAAIELIFLAAKQGYAPAQVDLANVLGNERHEKYGDSLTWFQKAAEAGSDEALVGLAFLYFRGNLVTKDPDKALQLLERAAKIGNPEADKHLCILYGLGLVGPKNQELTQMSINRLLNSGRPEAYNCLSILSIVPSAISPVSGTQRGMEYALEAVKNGDLAAAYEIATSALWARPPFVDFKKFQYAWFLIAKRAAKKETAEWTQNIDAVILELEKKLDHKEAIEAANLSVPSLVYWTEEKFAARRKAIGPVEPIDYIDEGWRSFVGARGHVDEPLAQFLTEEGLRLAIRDNDQVAVANARNDLGVILGDSANQYVANRRLSYVHLADGIDSSFGPNNLLWNHYLGNIHLDAQTIAELQSRYHKDKGKGHPTVTLKPLGETGRKSLPSQVAYLSAEAEKHRDPELMIEVAYLYESNAKELGLKNAVEWYRKASELGLEHAKARLTRVELILSGNYVKDMPDTRSTMTELFSGQTAPLMRGLNQSSLKGALIGETETNSSNGYSKHNLHALVIGNSRYHSRPLPNTINDAKLVGSKLEKLGFTVTRIEDVGRPAFVKALVNFKQSAIAADVTVLYYAGHGMQIGGLNYLLPTDINLDGNAAAITFDGISLNDVLREHLPGRSRLVFLDACRESPLSADRSRGAGGGLAPVNVSKGTLIAFATKDGGVAYDGDGKNSPYAESLVSFLDEDEDIAIVLRNVRDSVLKKTGGMQEPWEYGALGGGRLVLSRLAKPQ